MKRKNDSFYHFAEEKIISSKEDISVWKLVIVDADANLHDFIKRELKQLQFADKSLMFFDAYSSDEAKEILTSHPDIALAIIDSNLEGNHAGITLAKYIRTEMNNLFIRLVLYGDNFEGMNVNQFITQYDIHNCSDKNNLNKLYFDSVVLSGLRSYLNLQAIETDKVKSENITQAANRFIPHSFLEILKKDSIVNLSLGDHAETNISILFLDIRSFTTLSEFSTPTETYMFVNDCMSYLEPYIFRNKGFIDKYIGDSLMALFPESADDAIKAGIQMIQSLESYNLGRIRQRQMPINIGIGINTGRVIIGTVGVHDRLECTVISDAVNVASRIEKLNKVLGTQLLINDRAFLNLNDPEQFHYRSIGKQELHGKMQFHTIYEIFDTNPEDVLILKEKTLIDFSDAIMHYQNGEFSQAKRIFENIIDTNHHDSIAKYFLEKINK